MPLKTQFKTPLQAFLIALSCASSPAQAPGPSPATAPPAPTFEVSTVKPSDPKALSSWRRINTDGRQFSVRNASLKFLIEWAWSLQSRQLLNSPDWLDRNRFDIVANLDNASDLTDRQWKIAVRSLLADRFHLQVHHETRVLPAYALVLAKGGSKLRPTGADSNRDQGLEAYGRVGDTMQVNALNASMADLTGELQRLLLDRPIVDRTGLTGVYSFQLNFTREEAGATGASDLDDDDAPSLFNAIQQQLGLKLERTQATVDVLLIDQAQQPTPN